MEYHIHQQGSLIRAHTEDDDGKAIAIPLRGCRAALIWPTKMAGMYFLIIAQELSANPEGKCPLILVYEEMGKTPATTIETLLHMARQCAVSAIYADLNLRKHREMSQLFSRIARYSFSSKQLLKFAPIADNPYAGLGLIEEWLPYLTLEDGILRTETQTFDQNRLESEGNYIDKFPAIKALTYILSTLELHPWQMPEPIATPTRTRSASEVWGAFT